MPTSADSGTRCPQTQFISPNEALVGAVSFKKKLRSGELLSGTPTVSIDPSGPTISLEQRNSSAIVIDGVENAVDEAVLFKITGCTVGTDYIVTARCATTSSTQTKEATCDLRCRA
jgi:hypothetical protein